MTTRKLLSLVFVREASKILLGYKKRGFGQGWWNGFGGKVEKGETIMQGALRELTEESGLIGDSLEEIGLLTFEFEGDPVLLEVHVFSTTKFSGKPEETEEMRPAWFDIQDIPFKKMWSDDVLWFPLMLKGSKFKGYFLFKGLHDILKYKLDEVDKIEY
ncbi:oxidized purine nucleoside triphosphate hydrolase-like isoform X2 [Littorina saxatilis]|uniref:Oxidized purine nucleoside triphosphate hydrolase n=2 Tax=Littorina saxatilis TaxID=31220 RepID=A0AAN9GKE9_9CAEN